MRKGHIDVGCAQCRQDRAYFARYQHVLPFCSLSSFRLLVDSIEKQQIFFFVNGKEREYINSALGFCLRGD